jgi:hypothetical protein
MKPTPDAVLSLLNWWDGPLEGTTTFNGAPHRFNRVGQAPSRQGYAGVYELTPLSPDVAALEAEVWTLWSRWRAAWKAGETPRETWPALPADSERYKQIKAAIETAPRPNSSIRCRGVFIGSNEDLHLCSPSTSVRWTKTAESTP